MDKEDYQFLVTSFRLDRWHEFVNNPTYVKDTINEDYWNAYRKVYPDEEDDEDLEDNNLLLYLIIGISGGVVLIAGVIITICCLKERCCSDC